MSAVNELSAIPFGALIGGPMTAAIEAQSKAAMASVEFIRAVGFDSDGNVHNVVFKYKSGPGDSDVQELQVPPVDHCPHPLPAHRQYGHPVQSEYLAVDGDL